MLYLVLLFSVLVTVSHASALQFGKRHLTAPLADRERWWKRHLPVNGILWLILFVWILFLQFHFPQGETSLFEQITGLLLILLGIVLVVWSRVLLGRHQAMGIRFFLPERSHRVDSSLYRYLTNPMYDGFIFVLIGLGLLLGVKQDYLLAAASFILLNQFLARIENQSLR